jgi:acyl-coenzyme A synthetase/AMP-(fatty) acid ligase
MTYSQLAISIDRLHHSFRRRGLRPGDTVALIGANHIEIPITYFAVWKACGSCSALDAGLLAGKHIWYSFTLRLNFSKTN